MSSNRNYKKAPSNNPPGKLQTDEPLFDLRALVDQHVHRVCEQGAYNISKMAADVSDMETVLNNHMMTYMFMDGVFEYKPMSSTEFTQIIQEVLASGGYFVIPHPAQTAMEILQANGVDAYLIGEIIESEEKVILE